MVHGIPMFCKNHGMLHYLVVRKLLVNYNSYVTSVTGHDCTVERLIDYMSFMVRAAVK